MAKDFVIYRVHIHKVNQEELYKLLDSMPKSTRGLYIREALEHYAGRGLPVKDRRRGTSPFGAPSIRTLEERYDLRHVLPGIPFGETVGKK